MTISMIYALDDSHTSQSPTAAADKEASFQLQPLILAQPASNSLWRLETEHETEAETEMAMAMAMATATGYPTADDPSNCSLPQPESTSMNPEQVDVALDEYAQLWRQLVEEPSLLNSEQQPHQPINSFFGLGLEAEPTPPLSFEDLVAPPAHEASVPVPVPEPEPEPTVELVAPKPRRLVNPAIHLAALVEEDDNAVKEAEPAEEVQEGVLGDPITAHNGVYGHHSVEDLQEYMSESEASFDETNESEIQQQQQQPMPMLFSEQSVPLEDWTFPSIAPFDLQLDQPSMVSSPFPHLTSHWHPRTSMLREAMRERRVARLQGYAHTYPHSRHASVPDIQYRSSKWNHPAPATDAQRGAVPVRRRVGNASQSVDWSALGSYNLDFAPPLDDSSFLNASSYLFAGTYHRQSVHLPYGRL